MYNFGGVVVANIISKVIYLTKMSLDTLSGRFRHFHNLVYSALLKWPPPALMKLLSVFVFPAFSLAYSLWPFTTREDYFVWS